MLMEGSRLANHRHLQIPTLTTACLFILILTWLLYTVEALTFHVDIRTTICTTHGAPDKSSMHVGYSHMYIHITEGPRVKGSIKFYIII